MRLPVRLARREAAIPAVVWAVTALHLALLLVYAVVYPPYLSPDEPQHVDLVVALRAGDGWAGPGERILSQGVYVTADPIYPEGDEPAIERPYGVDDLPPRSERLSLQEAGGAEPSSYDLPNQLVQHPPLYYATGALLLAAVPGDGDLAYDRTVGLLRLLSVLLVAPLPLLVWAGARAVGLGRSAAAVGAVLPLVVPGITRIGASAGNDSLVVLAGVAATVALLRVAAGDLRRRTAVAAGTLVTLALLAKGFGLVFPPTLLLAYVVAAVRGRAWRPVVVPAVLAGATASVGLLWWVRNVVLYGAVQPNGFGREAAAELAGPRRDPSTTPDAGLFAGDFVEALLPRFWAPLGVVEPPTFSLALSVVLTVAVLAAVVAGLARAAAPRLVLALALVPVGLLLAITVRSAWNSYVAFDRPPGVQGRYLYAGVLGVLVVAAAGVGARRWVLPAVLLAALAVQAWALRLVVADLYVPDGGVDNARGDALDALLHVSAWPVGVTWAVLALAVLTALLALGLAFLRLPLQTHRPPIA